MNDTVEVMKLDFDVAYRKGTIDQDIVIEVFRNDVYRLRKWRLPPVPAIVDVGAHIGVFSLFAATLCPRATVVACEMDGENYALLLRNVSRYRNIHPRHVTVVGRPSLFGYQRNEQNTGGHHVVYSPVDDARPLPACRTLGGVLEEARIGQVDLLKLDCEGAEHDVLDLAASDGTLSRVQRISCEYHHFFGRTVADLVRTIEQAGFRVEQIGTNDLCGMLHCARPGVE
jgi:FkbM family methyltransferase